jgi:MFS family permease
MKFFHDKSVLLSLFAGVIPLFVMAHFAHHLLTALVTPLLPMIRSDFSLDYTQAGWVISAFHLSYGIGQLPSGWLADRIGPRIMITIGICGVALAGFFVGLSQTFLMMILFLILMGLMGGGYHPSAPPIISASVPPGNQGRALGFHMIGGSASFFLAPLIAAAIAASWGWRGAFIGLAVPATAFGILIYVILGKLKTLKPTATGGTKGQIAGSHPPDRLRHLIAFIMLSTFTGAITFSTTSFIPLFLVDHLGYSKETAGAFFAFIYAAGLWTGPLGGHLADRFGTVPVILTICFLVGPAIFLLNWVSSTWTVTLLLISIGMFIYVRMPVSEFYIIRHTSPHKRSTVLGIYFFTGMEGGGLLTPVMGYLIDHLGFFYSFMISGSALFIMTLIFSIILRSELKAKA